MFDDLEDGSHLGLWVTAGLLVMLLLGLVGGLWVQQHRAAKTLRVSSGPHLSAPAPAVLADTQPGMQLR
ncbi:hypothetical protein LRH25_20865 [Ideonella azotifigens]|uniref:hypothetical protein n=1 Tax=Ideonella azotifigens TaxID=513160 RepID=UPI0011429074|nr:hypothetical protein [Ideonella azotifigens]MCD2342785.1 hypothetical protein [Ideonella azotifigens]